MPDPYIYDGSAYGSWPESADSARYKRAHVIENLSVTQKNFAEGIFRSIVELLREDSAVLEIIRGSFPRTRTVERFREDLYLSVANYDAIRSEQLKYTHDELTRIISMMPVTVNLTGRFEGVDYSAAGNNAIPRRDDEIPKPRIQAIPGGNFDTSFGSGCDECGNTHGDAHSATCKRGKK